MSTGLNLITTDDMLTAANSESLVINCCNCDCDWSNDFQIGIKGEFRKAFVADLNTRKGDTWKLGKFTWSKERAGYYVINAYCKVGLLKEEHTPKSDSLKQALLASYSFWDGIKNIYIPASPFVDFKEEYTLLVGTVEEIFPDRKIMLVLDEIDIPH